MCELTEQEDNLYWFVLRGQSLEDWFIIDSDHICDRKVSNWSPANPMPSQEMQLPLRLSDSPQIDYISVKVLGIFEFAEEADEFKKKTLKEEEEALKQMAEFSLDNGDGRGDSLMDIALDCENPSCNSAVAQLVTELSKMTIVEKLQDEVNCYKKKTEHLEEKITFLENYIKNEFAKFNLDTIEKLRKNGDVAIGDENLKQWHVPMSTLRKYVKTDSTGKLYTSIFTPDYLAKFFNVAQLPPELSKANLDLQELIVKAKAAMEGEGFDTLLYGKQIREQVRKKFGNQFTQFKIKLRKLANKNCSQQQIDVDSAPETESADISVQNEVIFSKNVKKPLYNGKKRRTNGYN